MRRSEERTVVWYLTEAEERVIIQALERCADVVGAPELLHAVRPLGIDSAMTQAIVPPPIIDVGELQRREAEDLKRWQSLSDVPLATHEGEDIPPPAKRGRPKGS